METRTIELLANAGRFELANEPQNWVLKKGAGYSPVEMLASAVAGCGGYVYSDVLTNSKIAFTFEKISVSYSRNEAKKAAPLKLIDLTFFVKVAEEQQDRAIRCLRLVSEHCPVIQSLDPEIEVKEAVIFC